MAVGVVSDVRAVGEAEANGLDRLEHQAHVPAPGPAVALDVGVDRVLDRLVANGNGNNPAGAKFGLGVLERDAAADAELFIDLPGQVRVDVEGEDHGLGAALPAFPTFAVFRAHAVGDGETKTGPETVVDLMREEAGGNGLALETAVFALAGVAFVVKIDRNPGARRLHARAGEKRHARGVVVDGGKVVTHDAGAGHGAADLDGGLLGELEARSVGLGGKGAGNHHRSGGNLESRVLQRKTPVN